jgi:Bacterial capsule synthesis protein PGA_cap
VTLYGYPRQPDPESPDQPAPEPPHDGGAQIAEVEDVLGRLPRQRVPSEPSPWEPVASEPSPWEPVSTPGGEPDPLEVPAPELASLLPEATFPTLAPPEPPPLPELPALPEPLFPQYVAPSEAAEVSRGGGEAQAGPLPTDAAPDARTSAESSEPDPAAAVTPPLVRDPIVYLDDFEEPTHIPEWDRKPLMIVLAAGAVLIMLAVLSGVVTAAIAGGRAPAWQGVDKPSVTPPTASAPAAPGEEDDTITLAGVGDIIMGTQPGDLPPRGGSGFFDPVKDALAADLVMGNLETPLTEDTGRVKCKVEPTPTSGPTPTKSSGCFQLYLPTSYARHLRDGGFHLLNLANNHTNDMGAEGLRNTRTALKSVGIRYTGGPNEITYVDVEGIRVAVIGFSVYSWGQNLNNIAAARALVRKADERAEIVVIQMQGGAEGSDKAHVKPGMEKFLGENRGDLIAFTHAVVDAGADIVFGHGPHIMRGMEFYKGRLIAFSLGNFCGYGVLSSTGNLGVGGVLKVKLREDGTWAGGQLIATEMVRGGLPAPDDDNRALAFVRRLSREDFGTAAASISNSGAITPPPSS